MIDLLRANLRNLFRLSTAYMRREPDYMVIGAQKSGTTTLFKMLSQHPGIKNPRNKEMHFFDDRDIHSLRQYRGMYPFSRKELTGEATPLYLYYPGVAERIKTLFPQCKFIAVLRNPVDRAYSHYQMRYRRGKEHLGFEEAVAAEDSRLIEARENRTSGIGIHNNGLLAHSYIDRGVYVRQLEQWLTVFDRDQIHILSYENFIAFPQQEYDRICHFLQLPRYHSVVQDKANTANYKPMLDSTRVELERFYYPYNQKLFELIGDDFGWNRDVGQP